MDFERPIQKNDMRFWSVAEWKSNIIAADKDKKLAFFNDVISGKDAPALPDDSKHLVLQNVSMGGKLCDIYHWGQVDGNMEPQSSVNRVYVHVKE